VAEHRFHATRLWKFDFFWGAPYFYALEIEGVVYATERGDARLGGRHTSRRGFADDLEKYRAAFALGYAVLRCLPSAIQDGSAALAIEARMKRGRLHDTPTVPPTSDPCIAATRPARKTSRAATRRAWEHALVDRGAGADAAAPRAKRR
jgi:hypothetical protein